MRGPTPELTFMPAPAQALLLRAALADGATARAAWEEWRATVDFDRLDLGSQRLLPLLWRQLTGLGVTDPLLGRIKGFYRLAWARNQRHLHDLAALLKLLGAAGVPTLLLKGAALIPTVYRDPALRPMDDVDVLVPPERCGEVLALLLAQGWQPQKEGAVPVPLPEMVRLARHAFSLRGPAGQHLDLHSRVFWEWGAPDADAGRWAAAVPVAIEGVPTRALAPTDQLLHVCVHGARFNRVPPVRLVADAFCLLRTAGASLDWDRLAGDTKALHFVLPLRDTLGYLHDHLGAPVPAAVLERLAAAPITAADRTDYAARNRPVPVTGLGPWLRRRWERYSRLMRGAGRWRTPLGFGHYLQACGHLPPWHELPGRALRRVLAWVRPRPAAPAG